MTTDDKSEFSLKEGYPWWYSSYTCGFLLSSSQLSNTERIKVPYQNERIMVSDFCRQRWTTVGVVWCLMFGVWHPEALVIRPMVIRPTFSTTTTTTTLAATRNDADPTTTTTTTPALDNGLIIKAAVLAAWKDDSTYVQQMDVPKGFYALFHAIKSSGIALGLKGSPMVFRKEELPVNFEQFFTMKDLAKAVEDDFLDAAKGSTDNRKGWKVRK